MLCHELHQLVGLDQQHVVLQQRLYCQQVVDVLTPDMYGDDAVARLGGLVAALAVEQRCDALLGGVPGPQRLAHRDARLACHPLD